MTIKKTIKDVVQTLVEYGKCNYEEVKSIISDLIKSSYREYMKMEKTKSEED